MTSGAAAYFMLLLCVRLELFRCRFVPPLEPNPGDATAPRSNSQTLKFHSPVNPDALSARSLGFPKSPPLKKILDPPMHGHNLYPRTPERRAVKIRALYAYVSVVRRWT